MRNWRLFYWNFCFPTIDWSALAMNSRIPRVQTEKALYLKWQYTSIWSVRWPRPWQTLPQEFFRNPSTRTKELLRPYPGTKRATKNNLEPLCPWLLLSLFSSEVFQRFFRLSKGRKSPWHLDRLELLFGVIENLLQRST